MTPSEHTPRVRQSVGSSLLHRKLVLSLATCCAAGVLAEIGLRSLQWIRHGSWSVPQWLRDAPPIVTTDWHPFLRRVPRPGTTWNVVEGESQARIEINSLGFRSPEMPRTKAPGTLRVACLGGSVVYDTRVSLAESWPMRLQEQLRDRLHVPIEVINAGIPGRTSADTIVNLALRVLPLDPDVIIVVHGVNDQKPNRWPGFRDDYSHWYEPPASAAAVLLNSVIDHSLVLAHCRWRIRRLDPGYRDNVRGMLVERHDTVSPVGLEAYRRNLITISGMARAHGVILVLATVGHSLDGNADWQPCDGPNRLLYHHAGLTLQGLKHGFMEYNRVTREVAAEVAAPLVDIERHLPPGEQFFQDDVHFTAAGASRVADLFGELVLWTGWAGEAARSR